MYIGKGGARQNLGAELLRRGLAFGIYPVVERVKDSAELIAAEAEAKEAKRGAWEFYVEPVVAEEEEVRERERERGEYLNFMRAAAVIFRGAAEILSRVFAILIILHAAPNSDVIFHSFFAAHTPTIDACRQRAAPPRPAPTGTEEPSSASKTAACSSCRRRPTRPNWHPSMRRWTS